MKPCPHCGKRSEGFFRKGQMAGSVEEYYSADGTHEETNLDKTYWKERSSCIRCSGCGKIRRDVEAFGKGIRELEIV